MKHRVSRLPVLLMTAFFALSIIAGANAASNVPSEMEAWLKSAKLGPYDRAENWDDIVAMAKAEGEVVVYTSSGRIAKLVKRLNALYPEIKLTVHDLGPVVLAEVRNRLVIGNQAAGLADRGRDRGVVHRCCHRGWGQGRYSLRHVVDWRTAGNRLPGRE